MGFFDKLKKITTNLFSGFSEADEAFFEELEETLILADLGMDHMILDLCITDSPVVQRVCKGIFKNPQIHMIRH